MEFEEKMGLFDKSIRKIRYWQFLRTELYLECVRLDNGGSIAHPDLVFGRNGKTMIIGGLRLLINSFLSHYDCKDIDNSICICSARRNAITPAEILLQHYGDKGFLIDRPSKYEHRPLDSNIKRMDTDYLDLIRGIKIKLFQIFQNSFKNEIKREIQSWYPNLKALVGSIPSEKWIANRLIHQIISYDMVSDFFTNLFRVHQPKALIITNCYESFSFGIIAAAQRCNIPVLEVLHGYRTDNVIGYHHLNNHELIFPDIFLTFSEYCNSFITHCYRERFVACGSILMEYQKKVLPESPKTLITFASQGPYADILYPLAIGLVDILEDKGLLNSYKVVYKLHPGEINSWHFLHPQYNDKRITFVKNQPSIYQLMNESIIFIGINSTSVIESLEFGVRLGLVQCKYLPEMMIHLIENGYAKKISTPEDIYQMLLTPEMEKRIHSEYIWKSNALQNVVSTIDETIKSHKHLS